MWHYIADDLTQDWFSRVWEHELAQLEWLLARWAEFSARYGL